MKNLDYKKLRDFFPVKKEKELTEKLIEMWETDKEDIHIYKPEKIDSPEFPLCVPIGVIAGDWPGLSEAVLGTIHEKGWNLHYQSGMVVKLENVDLGIIIAVIKIENKFAYSKFLEDLDKITEDIRSISLGSLAKSLLLSIESKRLEIYSKVVDVIEKKADRDILNDLIGPEGEAFKFFASRSKAYIEQRKPEDLATQIMNNYFIQKAVIESKGEIQIKIRNISTTREELTAISIGVFEKDMMLKEILDSISYVIPDIKILYNKEFSNEEGVLVARIEVSDVDGNPYPEQTHERIKRVLKRLHHKARSETGRILESTGGFEHYLRAIIPFLIDEFEKTEKPQVFFSINDTSEFFLELKIILVCNKKKKVKKIMEGFDKSEGLSFLATHPPKLYGGAIVNTFDVRGELDKFESVSDFYSKTKEIIKRSVGEFRDFDEGMRKADLDKLHSISEKIPQMSLKSIKRIYYSIEGFWRISAPMADLVKVIRLADKIIEKWEGERVIVDHTNLNRSTAFIITSPRGKSLIDRIMDICAECDVSLSKIEQARGNILLVFVSQNSHPLNNKKIDNFIKTLGE